jgi:hypothetical protein
MELGEEDHGNARQVEERILAVGREFHRAVTEREVRLGEKR